MNEDDARKTIAKIDDLRQQARAAENMHTHWMGHNGELAIEHDITVKRRWRSDKTIHSEYVMTVAERDLFRTWLAFRASQLRADAGELSQSLAITQNDLT